MNGVIPMITPCSSTRAPRGLDSKAIVVSSHTLADGSGAGRCPCRIGEKESDSTAAIAVSSDTTAITQGTRVGRGPMTIGAAGAAGCIGDCFATLGSLAGFVVGIDFGVCDGFRFADEARLTSSKSG